MTPSISRVSINFLKGSLWHSGSRYGLFRTGRAFPVGIWYCVKWVAVKGSPSKAKLPGCWCTNRLMIFLWHSVTVDKSMIERMVLAFCVLWASLWISLSFVAGSSTIWWQVSSGNCVFKHSVSQSPTCMWFTLFPWKLKVLANLVLRGRVTPQALVFTMQTKIFPSSVMVDTASSTHIPGVDILMGSTLASRHKSSLLVGVICTNFLVSW